MRLQQLLAFGVSFFSTVALLAAGDGKLTVIGYVKSFDAYTVVLESSTSRFTIPRKLIKAKRFLAGEKLSVELDEKQAASFLTKK